MKIEAEANVLTLPHPQALHKLFVFQPQDTSENAVLVMHICSSVMIHSSLSSSYALFCHVKNKQFLKTETTVDG